jgi:predicted nucleic acid-binding protein
MILIDSSVWIDFFNGSPSVEANFLDQILGEQSLLVGDLILTEVLQGFRRNEGFEAARRALLSFQVVEMLNLNLAVQSARNYRTLRGLGIAVRKKIDCLIAMCCFEAGYSLLHSDRDIDAFEPHLGVSVIHP